jgi:hypothetical protein
MEMSEPFAPARLARLAIGTVLFFVGAWPYRDIFHSDSNRLLRFVGTGLTVVLIGSGLICLFWDYLT